MAPIVEQREKITGSPNSIVTTVGAIGLNARFLKQNDFVSDVTANADSMAAERAKVDEMITLDALRNSIPKEVFQKDLFKSLYYLFFDYAVWIGSFYAMYTFTNSPYWEPLPFWAKAVASLLYWNIAGFYMWCLFVVGHDCGHGTFSNNRVYPWQVRVSYMSMESLTCQSQNFTSLTVSIPSNIS